MTSGPEHRRVTRRTFLGLGAGAVTGAGLAACSAPSASAPRAGPASANPPPPGARAPRAGAASASASPRRSRPVPENSRPGDPDWEIRHLGAADEIAGYAGAASVLPGQSFPLFVSSASSGFRVSAFRLGWYGGDGARLVWRSGSLRGRRQQAAIVTGTVNTVRADWGHVAELATDDWPPGSYLLRLDADSGAQRYVPVTVRSPAARGKVVIKNAVATGQAYNPGGGYDLYLGPDQAYASRSLVVSLDRPYDQN